MIARIARLDRLRTWTAIALLVVALASIATSAYEFEVRNYSDIGIEYNNLHHQVLEGTAGNPSQYRALPEYIWDWLVRLQTARGSGDPMFSSILLIRYGQNLALFFLAYAYYRRLGIGSQGALVGISLVVLMLTAAYRINWIRLSSNFDAIFYLAAALLILVRRDWWIVPLATVAAINRETSGFMPFMLLLARWEEVRSPATRNRVLAIVGIATACWVAVYIALRLVYPNQALVTDLWGAAIQLNIFRQVSWRNLWGTFGILPVVALVGYARWPRVLQRWFWLIVPAWIAVHVLASLIDESLLFTEPVVLLLIPGALISARAALQPSPAPMPPADGPLAGDFAPTTNGHATPAPPFASSR